MPLPTMNRLRNRLILLFLAATLVPLGITLWFASSLFERSLRYSYTRELDELSRSLERTGREFYQRSREAVQRDASGGMAPSERYSGAKREGWPVEVRQFWESGDPRRFFLSGNDGDRLNYAERRGDQAWVWTRSLGAVGMKRLAGQYRRARAVVEQGTTWDLRRGFTYTFLLVALGSWAVAVLVLVFFAARLSRPIHELTAGLSRLASGDLSARVRTERDDEVGRAIQAFNDMAGQLEQSQKRLVYLTQLASWQSLARKMAHELKNSLTPIRLTVEEMQARAGREDQAFTQQAAQIVIDEVESLERRVRAFSQFATEPPVRPRTLDANRILAERVTLLQHGRADVSYRLRLAPELPPAYADEDLVKGVLTNLLENAAEAAGEGGQVLTLTAMEDGMIAIEVHDSGPGLSAEARESLFEPTISFKKHGMGLGLSIARKSTLLSGGDILLVKGELGGAAFRVLLPRDAAKTDTDR